MKDNEGFLHRHTGQESALNLHESMVIVGKSDWEKAREMFAALESVQVGMSAPVEKKKCFGSKAKSSEVGA